MAYACPRLGWMTHSTVKIPQTPPTPPCCNALSLIGSAGPKLDLLRNPPRTIKHLYSLLIAAIMDSAPPAIQAALSFTRQSSANLDAALDMCGWIAHPDVNRDVLSRCIPDSSTWLLTQFLARLLPMTDNVIALICQTEYRMSFIYKDALALYSVAMFAGTNTRKEMKNSAAIRAVFTRFLKSNVLSPQNKGGDVPLTQPPRSRRWWTEIGSGALGRYAWSKRRMSTHLRAVWLPEVALLASGSAASFLVGWAHGMIYCGTL